ncbi:MAG: transposase [Acidobacteria bacterium]|nr:transposase [Acidobacteriota bacterium]
MLPSPAGKMVEEEWKRTEQVRPHVRLDAWVMMPSHVHGIVILQTRAGRSPVETPRWGVSVGRGVSTVKDAEAKLHAGSLGAVIGQFKSVSTKRIRAAGVHDFAWQPRFYDRIIRDEKALAEIRAYILNNPNVWEEDEENPAKRAAPIRPDRASLLTSVAQRAGEFEGKR